MFRGDICITGAYSRCGWYLRIGSLMLARDHEISMTVLTWGEMVVGASGRKSMDFWDGKRFSACWSCEKSGLRRDICITASRSHGTTRCLDVETVENPVMHSDLGKRVTSRCNRRASMRHGRKESRDAIASQCHAYAIRYHELTSRRMSSREEEV